jgi:asparagine synthase (glutamine-hydrolysing)
MDSLITPNPASPRRPSNSADRHAGTSIMCGICGVYEFEGRRPAEACILDDMLRVLHHRGPDDAGRYFDKGFAFGMRRLGIIDLSGGKQPIFSEDGSFVLVFNGEIYNYRSLGGLLRTRGHTLATSSDTEVIVHLYEDYGQECVQYLRGMFAFAIWDVRRRQLFIARDRLGIKPLYFSQAGGRFLFGSEIKAILQHPAVAARINLSALNHFLSLKYVPAPLTMFEGIFALPPGCSLTCDAHGVRIDRYWDLSFANRGASPHREEVYAEQLEALLRETVQSHLVSDVPFGAFLSGGLDSSTIVALMSQFLRQPIKTYSVGFEGAGEAFSELRYARAVAKQFQTDHHEVVITAEHLLDRAEEVAWHLDQPLAEHATLANYMVAELAARDVKMVLTGEGGDELFAGYARYAGERLSPLFRIFPGSARSLVAAANSSLPGLRRQKLALYALSQSTETMRFLNWFPLFNSEMKQALLSEDLKETLHGEDTDHIFAEHLERTDAADSVSRMLYVDTKLWLPDLLLARGDKMSMAASLEARVPLLDHALVEFAASLPRNLKVRGLVRKYLLKRVSRAWLPREIVYRKKQGFPTPASLWLRRQARSFMRDHLSPMVLRHRGLFNPDFVEKLISQHENGFADHGSLLWGLISVELWQRIFLDSRLRPERDARTLAAQIS